MIFNIGSGPVKKLPVLDASYPLDKNVNVGETVSFEVKIAEDGKPPEYTYQWYYDGSAVGGATGAVYSREADWGTHEVYCMVTNKAGAITSRKATLAADTLYLFNGGVLNEAVTGGITGTLSAGVISFPAVSISKSMNKTYSTKKTVNLANVDTIRVIFKPTASSTNVSGNVYFRLILLSAPQTGASIATSHGAYVAHADVNGNNWVRNADNEFSADVSALDGEYYLGYAFGVYSSSSSSKVLSGEISKWWLE